MCGKFNIKVTITPAYSLWSNGLCKHYNQFLTKMLDKILDDAKCDYVYHYVTSLCVSCTLAWAVSAKNAVTNCNRFSPAQLVFG